MFPVGSYDRLVQEIKYREDCDIPLTFGILIADYRQQKCREYIINYISRFDSLSGKYINFYLPGYLTDEYYKNDNKIYIHNINYYFHYDLYNEFLEKLESDFNILYPYNPILLLVEYSNGHFKLSKKIRFELDKDGSDIKTFGSLFELIVEIAKKEVNISDFRKGVIKQKIMKSFFDDLIKLLDNKYFSLGVDVAKNIHTYKLG